MKIAFEEWLDTQPCSEDARGCFEEAFLCYRINAYRAALLFSYMGFMSIVRDRVLVATSPLGFPVGKLEALKQRLRTETSWDEAAFEAVEVQQPTPLFNLTDDLRRQVRYWRDRRNDCAHTKSQIIDSSHVESQWAFLRSRLAVFVVVGSKDELMTRILDHYDPTLTAAGRPANQLVVELGTAILPTGYPTFCEELSGKFAQADRSNTAALLGWPTQDELAFFETCLRVGTPRLQSEVGTHLIKSETRLLHFLVRYPHHVGLLTGHPQVVRKLWKTKLADSAAGNFFPLVAALVRNGMLPNDEMQECFRTLLTAEHGYAPNSDDCLTLNAHGFLSILEDVACVKMDRFGWGNSNYELVQLLLAKAKISARLAEAIYDAFRGAPNPRVLKRHLNEYFAAHSEKRKEYSEAISVRHSPPVYPSELPALAAERAEGQAGAPPDHSGA